jgi:predicted RNA-binding protein YlxR (DUF448 family)
MERPGGRGAWLCEASLLDCFDLARQRKSFGRALRCSVDERSLEDVRLRLDVVGRAGGARL